MQHPIIEVKNIGKKYNITHQFGGYLSFRDVAMNTIKYPVTFIKKKTKRIVGLDKQEVFWALRDINFEVQKGEVIGIIGSNGAGKSTLLKILSQITPPTTGEIKINGTIGSLLEVGTGFHPELTGRENIFLNGAILGMSKNEITEKFDTIVNFAGIDKFLDTPVKHYSSGMSVRLAFSVAAHMEPDILIIDEVLAVGDAEFQKKCLGKMEEITNAEGRTILFVSHDMGAIKQLCKKCVLLKNGKIKYFGDTKKAIEEYLKISDPSDVIKLKDRIDRKGNGKVRIVDYNFTDKDGNKITQIKAGDDVILQLKYEKNDDRIKEIDLTIGIDSVPSFTRIIAISNKFIGKKISIENKSGYIDIIIDKIPLNSGNYKFTTFIEDKSDILDWVVGAGEIGVFKGDFYKSGKTPDQGIVLINYDIKNE